jgi:RsiW-degrading membrane proteinase PrsW (M82 family)
LSKWHFIEGSASVGPYDTQAMRQLLASGRIGPTTLVWSSGLPGWTPLSGVAELAQGAPRSEGPTPPPAAPAASTTNRGIVENISGRIGKITETEHVKVEHVGGLFSEVMKRHSEQEMEAVFAAGMSSTPPHSVKAGMMQPTPWVYTRVLGFFGLAFLGLWLGWREFENLILIPGLILIGAFAFPLGTALFFFECNAPRNISLFTVMKLFVWGGVLGILFSLIGFELTERAGSVIGPPIAGIIEEPGKLAAVIVLANGMRYRWSINGLVLGAAVGAGFAAFESAGYAFRTAVESNSDREMLSSIMTRGVLAPFGHVVWTAIAAGALWRVRAGRPFDWAMLSDRRCLAPLIAVMVLHATWNSPIPAMLPFFLGYFALGAVGWVIAIGLLLGGLQELRNAEQANAATGAVPVQ